MKRATLFLLGTLALIPTPTGAQAVTIAVDITDPTGGIISNSLTAALQDLLDVGVLPEDDRPRYVLRGLAMCQPDTEDCGEAASYILALALVEPLNPVVLLDLARAADASLTTPTSPAFSTEVWDRSSEYMKIHRISASNLGRGVYDQAIRGFVATLNARCFEKARVLRRWMLAREEGRLEDASALSKALEEGDWIC